MGRLALVSLVLVGACAGSGSDGTADGGVVVPPAVDASVDDQGFADFGGGFYPPLRHRVEALPCTPLEEHCTTDAECAAGEACVCDVLGFGDCQPAECRTDADCSYGYCLVSEGPIPGWCDDNIAAGLFCSRRTSTCASGGNCPGNGIACLFLRDSQRFECALNSATKCPT